MNYTQNHDPNYYEKHQDSSNCGSFAFQIEEWYSPDEYFEDIQGQSIEEWIERGLEVGYDEWELSDLLADLLSDYVLMDFEDVHYLWSPAEVQDNEELIAFRAFVSDDCNWDFHFKVFRDGIWQEKCGSDPVRFCSEDDWHNGIMDYNSYTVYFAKKLAS